MLLIWEMLIRGKSCITITIIKLSFTVSYICRYKFHNLNLSIINAQINMFSFVCCWPVGARHANSAFTFASFVLILKVRPNLQELLRPIMMHYHKPRESALLIVNFIHIEETPGAVCYTNAKFI